MRYNELIENLDGDDDMFGASNRNINALREFDNPLADFGIRTSEYNEAWEVMDEMRLELMQVDDNVYEEAMEAFSKVRLDPALERLVDDVASNGLNPESERFAERLYNALLDGQQRYGTEPRPALDAVIQLCHWIMRLAAKAYHEKDDSVNENNESDDDMFGKKWYENINYSTVELDGVDRRDAPDFADAYITYAETNNGVPLTDDQLDQLTDMYASNGKLHELIYDKLYENVDADKEFDDNELFGKTTVFKTVQKLLAQGATVEMRHMSGRPMKVTGAQEVDGYPYMFGMSLTNPKSRARLSHPWSENSELNVGLVEVGPNHYAIVKRNTLMRRGNKYTGQPRLAEEDEVSDDELFGARRMWYVNIMGNWNTGRYSDYGARRYIVPGATAQDALKWLKNNEDMVMAYLDGQKSFNGKRIVRRPARSNVFLDNSTVYAQAPEGTDSAIERFIRKHRAIQ